jgi:hypothetical protein
MTRVFGCRVLLSSFRHLILKPDTDLVTEMNDIDRDCRKCRVLGQRRRSSGIETCGLGSRESPNAGGRSLPSTADELFDGLA